MIRRSTLISLLILLILCFSATLVVAENNLYKAISDAEKTVFSISTYTRSGTIIGKSAGFFIGSGGLAVCRASIFLGVDSIKITDSRKLELHIERVVAVHQAADLAMIKIVSSKSAGFSFLLPSSSLFREEDEVLIFSNPELGSDGAQLERLEKVIDKPFFNRLGILKANLGVESIGSPVINSKGELVGVTGFFKSDSPSFIYNCATLSDTNWVSMNIPTKKLRESALKQAYMTSNLSKGLLSITFEDWIGAAKNLTIYLKVFTTNSMCYALRGYARFMYNNKEESKLDFATARLLNATGYLTYYYQALIALKETKYERAYALVDSSVFFQYKFPPSRVLRGNLILETDRPVNDALLDYSYAIQTNPTFAEAYYQRCLFLKKYTKNLDLAFSDISQCAVLNPSLTDTYLIKGMMNIKKENYIEAQKDLNNAVRKNPTNDEALLTRGYINYQLGLKGDACQDWRSASDMGNEDAMIYLLKYCDSERHGKSKVR